MGCKRLQQIWLNVSYKHAEDVTSILTAYGASLTRICVLNGGCSELYVPLVEARLCGIHFLYTPFSWNYWKQLNLISVRELSLSELSQPDYWPSLATSCPMLEYLAVQRVGQTLEPVLAKTVTDLPLLHTLLLGQISLKMQNVEFLLRQCPKLRRLLFGIEVDKEITERFWSRPYVPITNTTKGGIVGDISNDAGLLELYCGSVSINYLATELQLHPNLHTLAARMSASDVQYYSNFFNVVGSSRIRSLRLLNVYADLVPHCFKLRDMVEVRLNFDQCNQTQLDLSPLVTALASRSPQLHCLVLAYLPVPIMNIPMMVTRFRKLEELSISVAPQVIRVYGTKKTKVVDAIKQGVRALCPDMRNIDLSI